MASALEKLTYSIILLDKFSAPGRAVQGSMEQIQKTASAGFADLKKGLPFVTAGVAGLKSMVDPARDMQIALNEVSSLGVLADELEKLRITSDRFAMAFGGNAVDVARSAYDIQSAIPGLVDGALAAFTENSAVLAKATKGDTQQMSAYMGSMYNIFSESAEKIGQAEWVNQLTGQTAKAVQIFKTDGGKMEQAFKSLGSTATVAGVNLAEQMASLGVLQGTMESAQAGTGLRAFYTKLGTAGQKLGIQVEGDDGVLPINEIVAQIEAKTAGLSETAKLSKLSLAFGETGAQAVMNMLGKTEQLASSIEQINSITDNSPAVAMAETMIDQSQRFGATLNVLSSVLGSVLLPPINFLLGTLATLGQGLVWLMELFPPLKWAVSLAVASISLFTVALGGFYMISGIIKLSRAFILVIQAQTVAFGHSTAGIRLYLIWCKIAEAAQKGWAIATAFCSKVIHSQAVGLGVSRAALVATTVATYALTAAQWAYNAALYANPIVWVVAAIIAVIGVLVGAVVLVIKYWDEIIGFFALSWDWMVKLTSATWGFISAMFDWGNIVNVVESVWDYLKGFASWFSDIFGAIGDWFSSLFGGGDATVNLVDNPADSQPTLEGGVATQMSEVRTGGISNSSSVTTNYGGVTINSSRPLTPSELDEYMLLQA